MSSLLTASGFKGRFLYLGLIMLFSLFISYWVFFKNSSAIENIERQSVYLTYSAFKNGIRLSNNQFIVKKNNVINQSNLITEIHGLKFNLEGFPIAGINTNSTTRWPNSREDCRVIWQKVLGPLQPELSDKPDSTKPYWVSLSSENICIYHSSKINGSQIQYDAVNGLVSLLTINR